jgi:divalent metal cation (Fe/Co/Zn/Cd) transporter
MSGIESLRADLVYHIINPVLLLVFAVGLLIFVFGLVEFLYGLNAETDAREKGKKHMLWGLVGMFIMMVAYSIVILIIRTVGGVVDSSVQLY